MLLTGEMLIAGQAVRGSDRPLRGVDGGIVVSRRDTGTSLSRQLQRLAKPIGIGPLADSQITSMMADGRKDQRRAALQVPEAIATSRPSQARRPVRKMREDPARTTRPCAVTNWPG